MATQTQQWIPLDECVYAYIDRSEQSQNKYFKLWNIAYDGCTQMGLDAFFIVKSIMLPVNANLTANLPENYLQWAKIGYVNECGEVVTLKRNDRISKLNPFSNKRSFSPIATGLAQNSYLQNDYYNFNYDGVLCNVFGCGLCNSGGVRVDEEQGLIFLNGTGTGNIVLEYLASPEPDKEVKIPIQFKEAIIEFVGWKDIKHLPNSRKGSLGDKRDRKSDYYNERRLAIARFKPFRIGDVSRGYAGCGNGFVSNNGNVAGLQPTNTIQSGGNGHVFNIDDLQQGITTKKLSVEEYNFLVSLMAVNNTVNE